MRYLSVLALILAPLPAWACGDPVCRVDPTTLELSELIHFDDIASGWDPGVLIDDKLSLPGASFAERFLGQTLEANGNYDTVTGRALDPLELVPGAPGQTLSVVRLRDSNILNGFGPAGFPKVQAQGEGAIAVLFDDDQPAFSVLILGGEDGSATIQFLNRLGDTIDTMTFATDGPLHLGFRRNGDETDIAGFVITNLDPEGLAIDNLRFGPPPQLG